MALLSVSSTLCLHAAIIVFLSPQYIFATSTHRPIDEYAEIDFSCLIGDIDQDCKEGESGSKRFYLQNVTMLTCKTVEEFFGSSDETISVIEPRSRLKKRSEDKIFACASYFEWEMHTENHPSVHNIEEMHGCLYDTRIKLREAMKEASSKDCIKATGKWHTVKINQKKCLCYKGHSCNSKFERKFKGEPPAVSRLCRQKVIKDEEDNNVNAITTSGAKTTSTCITNTFFFLSLFWLF